MAVVYPPGLAWPALALQTPTGGMSTILTLERGLTANAFNAYLESEPRIAELAGTLADGVDGDLLIDTIKSAGAANA